MVFGVFGPGMRPGRTRFLPALLVLLPLAAGPAAASPHEAIAKGDMQAVIGEIIALYEAHGLSWDRRIPWQVGPYTTTYWYYSSNENNIVAGDMPRPDQIADYWRTWSKALTDGHWDPDGFFTSDEEALQLAWFNQYVLATHESAHAITYRYDPGHRRRHDHDVNCREYYADRLTVAILEDQAAQDTDMARWRGRYLDLMTDMGASIPPKYRVPEADYAALERDCTVIQIDQPTPAYASAYFTRYAALLKAELPQLDAVFDTHLKTHHRQKLAEFPMAPDWANHRVETLARIDRVAKDGSSGHLALTGFFSEGAAGFAPDGQLFVAEVQSEPHSGTLEIVFGAASDAALRPVDAAMAWPRKPQLVSLESIAVFGPDEFVATFEEIEDRTSVLRFHREAGTWHVDRLADQVGIATSRAFRVGDDRLFVGFSQFAMERGEEAEKYWLVTEIDKDTGAILSTHAVQAAARAPIGADAEGRLYFDFADMIIRAGPGHEAQRVAGNWLAGNHDGDAITGETANVMLAQIETDGSLLFLDDVAGDADHQLVRRVIRQP